MKKHLLSSVALLAFGLLYVSAQTVVSTFNEKQSSPYQIADTAKEWNTVGYGYWSWNVVVCGGTQTLWFDSDTILEGKEYLKVFESMDSVYSQEYNIGGIREDTFSKSVYYHNYDPLEGEGLIYDFSLQVGDSVTIDNYFVGFEDVVLHCVLIDTVNILGVDRNRLFLKEWIPNPSYADIWIEGIGSINGLLTSGIGGAGYSGGGSELLCCKEHDTLIYFDTIYNTCYIDEFLPKIISEYYDTAYLNTPYEFQIQLSDTSDIDSIWWEGYAPDGFVFDEITGIISGFPTDTGSFNCVALIHNEDYGHITDMLNSPIIITFPTYLNETYSPLPLNTYPNPFTTTTTIEYELTEPSRVQLSIYNAIGETIYVTEESLLPQGKHTFTWSPERLPQGMYYGVLRSEEGVSVVKMVKQ
ncbi:MAG: T9SS type A sorting domain-containing protein [Bacteroidales bacterium]|nr:T9SS type A sorting domain-containing protein [Bacteroidales bacterium]